MNTIWGKLSMCVKDPDLRKKLLFVLLGFALFRLGANIPIPGVDAARLSQFFNSSAFFGLLNIFSGGGLSTLSVFMLGVGPYITASIIMQLLTMISPKLKEMYHEEGAAGRRKFAQYSRIMTVPLAAVQGFSLLTLLARQGVLGQLTSFELAVNMIVVTAGAVLLMWIAELMTEYGIGSGMSLLIFAGIVARFPADIAQIMYVSDASQIPVFIALALIAVLSITAVVVITEAERPIPVTYAKRIRGMKVYGGGSTYLPLRLNQAGVIPIIFAISILLLPQMLGSFLSATSYETAKTIGDFLLTVSANTWVYGIGYFLLVVLFTFFYTAVTFDPNSISENLQKSGAFISGIRPGKPTSEYLSRVLTRITVVGALFLGVIAILPLLIQKITSVTAVAIGGTALLIVVQVILELVKQIEAQLSMREY